jgi:hypothetical protein
MIKEAAPAIATPMSRGGKLLLIFVATPFMSGVSFATIVLVSRFAGYNLFGRGDWGIIPWGGSQILASVALILAVAISEGLRAGGLKIYTILGCAVGVLVWLLVGIDAKPARGLWIVPLQFGLIGHLLGRIAYRGVNRPAPAPDSTSGAKEKSEKET